MSGKEWFELHIEDINSYDDFEEAMELAYTVGFSEGSESISPQPVYDQEVYNEGYEDATKEECRRIINLIKEDQANGTLGFIQYERLLELLGENK